MKTSSTHSPTTRSHRETISLPNGLGLRTNAVTPVPPEPLAEELSNIPSFGSLWIDQRGSEVLERNECLRLLALSAHAGEIGRLGISTESSPIVTPVNFAYQDSDVIIRTGPGFIADQVPGQLVAFEVDHVDHDLGVAWSVLLRGLATSLPLEDLPAGLEPLVPRLGSHLISIRSDVLTGRRFTFATPADPTATAARDASWAS